MEIGCFYHFYKHGKKNLRDLKKIDVELDRQSLFLFNTIDDIGSYKGIKEHDLYYISNSNNINLFKKKKSEFCLILIYMSKFY